MFLRMNKKTKPVLQQITILIILLSKSTYSFTPFGVLTSRPRIIRTYSALLQGSSSSSSSTDIETEFLSTIATSTADTTPSTVLDTAEAKSVVLHDVDSSTSTTTVNQQQLHYDNNNHDFDDDNEYYFVDKVIYPSFQIVEPQNSTTISIEPQQLHEESSSTTEFSTSHKELNIYPDVLNDEQMSMSRRKMFSKLALGAVGVTGLAVVGGKLLYEEYFFNENNTTKIKKKLAPVNITQVAKETTINITMECTRTCISLDSKTFQKKQTIKVPEWVPAFLVPPPKVIKDITNTELLIATMIAGSIVEMIRTAILYPIQTLKTRIQYDFNIRDSRKTASSSSNSNNIQLTTIKRRIKIMKLNAIRHFREGQLYAGLLPSLLVSVPATGMYYAGRDISLRTMSMASSVLPKFGDIPTVLIAALVGDVVSLMFRTPADTLALRLQVATGEEGPRPSECDDDDDEDDKVAEAIADAVAEARVEQKVGNWFTESLQRLPAVIVTDLPYLLSRIGLNSVIMHGQTMDIGRYELITFTSAVFCAVITTPFDVARTRILVDSDGDQSNGKDGGSGKGVIETFQSVIQEGDGGVRNLFAGWLERTAYLGIASLWLPFGFLLYRAIRDAILLEWFD